ncbi:MAG: hypothetical protein ACK4N5_07815, partial [Myxococcales bacterium]
DLDRIIDEETAAAGLRIADEARAALKALIGSDRMISRSEVQKLCLYAEGKSDIGIDDVRALAKPVLRHRLLTNFHAESEGITSAQVIDRLLGLVKA